MQGGLKRGLAAYEDAKEMQQPRETARYSESVAPIRDELVRLAAQLAALRREGADEAAQRRVLSQMRRLRRELESVPVCVYMHEHAHVHAHAHMHIRR